MNADRRPAEPAFCARLRGTLRCEIGSRENCRCIRQASGQNILLSFGNQCFDRSIPGCKPNKAISKQNGCGDLTLQPFARLQRSCRHRVFEQPEDILPIQRCGHWQMPEPCTKLRGWSIITFSFFLFYLPVKYFFDISLNTFFAIAFKVDPATVVRQTHNWSSIRQIAASFIQRTVVFIKNPRTPSP